jgi:Uncharacterised nucleotidyltransferase
VRTLPTSDSSELWADVQRLTLKLPSTVARHQRLATMSNYLVTGINAQSLTFPVLTSVAVLEQVRRSSSVPLMLLKGLQIGALYPEPWMRDTGDIDILTTDPERLFSDLVGVGFVPREIEANRRHHQLPPLSDPTFGVVVEVHRRPNTGAFGPVVSVEECFAQAVPSRTEIDGLLGPSTEHEFVLHLAHSWADRPLGRLRDLIDLELLSTSLGGTESVRRATRRYKLFRVWELTAEAQSWAVHGNRPTKRVARRGKHLEQVFNPGSDVIRRLASPFWSDSVTLGIQVAGRESARALSGNPGESVVRKIKRVFG